MAIVQTERRKRGLFGWLVAILFWGFNILMLLWVIFGIGAISDSASTAESTAEKAGVVIGAGLGMGMVLTLWFLGAIILGIMMFFTRGKKIIVTVETPR